MALGDCAGVLKVLGQTQQDAHRQLVVQKAALDIAGGGEAGAGFEAHHVPHLDPQRAGLLGGPHVLVQHHLAAVEGALGIAVLAVDVDGGVAQLEGSLQHPPATGVDPDVLRLAVFRPHPAQGCQAQAAIALYLRHHAAQRVGVSLQQQALAPAAQIHQHAALGGMLGGIAQLFKGPLHPICRTGREARGAIDGQQLHGLPGGVFCIGTFHDPFLRIKYMWYSGFSSEAAQEDEGHAHVLPLQIPVLPQMGILLQGPAGGLIEDGKPFPRHHSGDAPLLLLGQQVFPAGRTDAPALAGGAVPVDQLQQRRVHMAGRFQLRLQPS